MLCSLRQCDIAFTQSDLVPGTDLLQFHWTTGWDTTINRRQSLIQRKQRQICIPRVIVDLWLNPLVRCLCYGWFIVFLQYLHNECSRTYYSESYFQHPFLYYLTICNIHLGLLCRREGWPTGCLDTRSLFDSYTEQLFV